MENKIDGIQKLFRNLTYEETTTLIKSFHESVNRFIYAALEQQKKQPSSESFNSIRLEINQINLLRVLKKNIKDDLDFIENLDLLSEEMLDAKSKEIKEKMEKEIADGETAMLAFTEHNPLKTLNKALKGIETTKDQLGAAGDFSHESAWF